MQDRKSVRRRSRRMIEPISILVFWKGKSGRYEADICDIGMGGCFLNTNGNADDGENIKLEVPTAEKVFELKGTVILQARKFKGFGVRFDVSNERQQSLIARLMIQSEEQLERRNKK